MRSKRKNAPTNSTSPSTVNTMPATTFDARFLSTSGFMSFPSEISAGAGVEIRGSIGSRIVTHTAWDILHFSRACETPATPLGHRQCRDEQDAEHGVQQVLAHHSSELEGA